MNGFGHARWTPTMLWQMSTSTGKRSFFFFFLCVEQICLSLEEVLKMFFLVLSSYFKAAHLQTNTNTDRKCRWKVDFSFEIRAQVINYLINQKLIFPPKKLSVVSFSIVRIFCSSLFHLWILDCCSDIL